MIIDHIGMGVADYEASKAFYLKSLEPLGISLVTEIYGWAGFGKENKAEFWIGTGDVVQHPMHIAFLADSREDVDRFYQAAISAGAADNGQPGIRERYHANYYGAFVIDPDGHNIEAVCHKAINQ
ncbi:VOC family protein [Vibrio quintilis]|uniref:Glyoxalase-like domain protein n=1 Tax=Vibrio quintilis TaxID=1117707 RepID=A0A1M7YVY8_9VIBR|nr:VOC family protein [Vibrio quintilis]SHO56748.1 Glyoxalase-like domain protein [Vibrio quintilis]